jgi:heptosyltransferase-3
VLRYCGEKLPLGLRIAVVSNDAIGNYVVVTPLLQMLKASLGPKRLVYFSGPRTEELWSRDPNIDRGAVLFGPPIQQSMTALVSEEPFDLVINVEWSAWAKVFTAALCRPETYVCGPCVGPGGRGDLPFADDLRGQLWQDSEWIAPDLTERYPFLKSGFIGEIFCRLAYLEGEIPPYGIRGEPVNVPIPDVLIAMSASLPEKLWPIEKWREVLSDLQGFGISVGLLGAPPSSQGKFWLGNAAESAVVDEGLAQDLRGKFSLPEVIGALGTARAVLTLDNGILHLSSGLETPTIGLYREGIHRLWAPPGPNITVLLPEPGETVASISADKVIEELKRVL